MKNNVNLLRVCLALTMVWSSLPLAEAIPAKSVFADPATSWTASERVRILPAPTLPGRADFAKDPRRLQIGLGRSFDSPIVVNSNTVSAGQWTSFADGWRVLSLGVKSEGALGLRLHLENLSLPPGSRLVVYDPANPQPDAAPVTPERLGSQKECWTPTLFAAEAVVECQVPPGADPNALAVTVSGVSHLYALAGTDSNLKEGSCNLDVTCYPGYAREATGVARIAFISGGNTYLCSGCRLQGADGSGSDNYFLTANHCVGDQTEASTVELFWLFQTSSCNGAAPSLSNVPTTSGGADLLATSIASDFTFVRLRASPPSDTYALSWSTTAPTTGETLVGIHHPSGAYKRICFGKYIGGDSDFWGVKWSSGVTEPGSSGSPLLNSQHQVIGQLNGGFEGPGSSCSTPSDPDQYGRFDVSYQSLQTWLGGGGSNPGGTESNAPTTYTALKGAYYGLFSDADNGPSIDSAGRFVLSTTTKSRFSAQIVFAGARYSIAGQLDGTGAAQASIKRRNADPLQVQFQIDPDDIDHVTGTLSGDAWSATMDGDRATFDGHTSIPSQMGQYTAILPGSTDSGSSPAGDGYEKVTVSKKGSISMAGSLADGTGISQSVSISKEGRWPVFLSLYSGKGFVYGWISFTNAESSGLGGDLTWSRPALKRAKAYGDGFDVQTTLTGSLYARPGKGVAVLNMTDATVTLSGATLASPVSNNVTLQSNNRVLNLSSNKVSLSISTSTGLFSGSVRDLSSRSSYSFHGAVLQNQQAGSGYFLVSGQSGQVTFAPMVATETASSQ